jgi:hypothetical protein
MGDKLFLSYARPDSDFALQLARYLRASSVNIWVDQLDIRPGDPWDRAVEDALKACTGVLVVLSPSSIDSRSVMDEVSYALEENKRVIPIVYRACPIPFRLRRLQHTDFTSDYQRALSVLVPALGATTLATKVPHDLRISEALSPPPDSPHPVQDAVPEPPSAESPHLPWGSRHPRMVSAIKFGVAGTLFSEVVSKLAFLWFFVDLVAGRGKRSGHRPFGRTEWRLSKQTFDSSSYMRDPGLAAILGFSHSHRWIRPALCCTRISNVC